MTIADLVALAADTSSARAIAAGDYARKALEALRRRDWQAANNYLMQAIASNPKAYAPALALVDRCRAGVTTSAAKRAASRANGAKGGRPRKRPEDEA